MQTRWLRGEQDAPDPQAGPGIFETFRWHNGPPPAWRLHGQRWQAGLAALQLASPQLSDLLIELREILPPAQPLRARLRLFPTGRVQLAWRPLEPDELTPRPWRLLALGRAQPRPPHLQGCKPFGPIDTQAWRTLAQQQDADEALLLGPQQQWAETPTANLLVGLQDGKLVTPHVGSGALLGTTLEFLSRQLPIDRAQLDASVLPHLRWAVLLNAIVLVRPVLSIDRVALPPPPSDFLHWVDDLRR